MSNVTAIILNWMTARMTLGCAMNFRKFYPDVPLIVADDHSNEEDLSYYKKIYNREMHCGEEKYDPDWKKLEENSKKYNYTFVRYNSWDGHGLTIDKTIKFVNTEFFLMIESDLRVKNSNVLSEYLDHMKDPSVAAVGTTQTKDEYRWVMPSFALYRKEPFLQCNASFAFYHDPKGEAWDPGATACHKITNTFYDRKWKSVFLPKVEKRPNDFIHLRKKSYEKDEQWDRWY